MVVTRCLMVHFGVAAVRTVWASLLNAAAGRALSYEITFIVALELLAAALWRAARPGHARESLPVLKAFNITQVLMAVLQFLYIFEYYVADLRKLPDLGAVAAERLAAEGLVSSEPASLAPLVDTLRGFTLFLDTTLLLFVLFGARTAHVMIMDKMEAQKARELKRAGGGAGGGAAAGTFEPESTTGLAALARKAPVVAAAAADRDEGAAVVKAAQATDRTRARRRQHA